MRKSGTGFIPRRSSSARFRIAESAAEGFTQPEPTSARRQKLVCRSARWRCALTIAPLYNGTDISGHVALKHAGMSSCGGGTDWDESAPFHRCSRVGNALARGVLRFSSPIPHHYTKPDKPDGPEYNRRYCRDRDDRNSY